MVSEVKSHMKRHKSFFDLRHVVSHYEYSTDTRHHAGMFKHGYKLFTIAMLDC